MPPPKPRFSTRLRTYGLMGLWILEWGANAFHLPGFLLRRRAVRRQMHDLIVLPGDGADNHPRQRRNDHQLQYRLAGFTDGEADLQKTWPRRLIQKGNRERRTHRQHG